MPYVGNIPAEKYAAFNVQDFTTSATTSYTLDRAVANELDIRLVINNVIQQPGVGKAYTAAGTTLTLSGATTGTDTMYAVYIGKAVQTVNPGADSVGPTALQDNSVTEAKLNVSNSPTNGYVLSAQSGATGGLTWAADAAGTITAFTNGVDNRVVTATSATALNGEASLLFDGTKLGVGTTGAGAASTGKVSVSSGSGGTMPESVTAANSYVALGNNEYGASAAGKVMIALGYTGGAARTNAPAYIGYEEVLNSGYTKGNLTFYTRDVTTDTAPTKTMEINTAGAVTKPLQPAFLIRSNDLTNFGATGYHTIPFANEYFDQNSDFNTSTYTFTAPVTGKYQFQSTQTMGDGIDFSNYLIEWNFFTSNTRYRCMTINPSKHFSANTNDYNSICFSVLADMDANDTAYLAVQPSAGSAVNDILGGSTAQPLTTFSGFLAC